MLGVTGSGFLPLHFFFLPDAFLLSDRYTVVYVDSRSGFEKSWLELTPVGTDTWEEFLMCPRTSPGPALLLAEGQEKVGEGPTVPAAP